MITMTQSVLTENIETLTGNDNYALQTAIENSWSKIAPFWPLKNLIAVNPLAGFENLTFEKALEEAHAYFQPHDIPIEMQSINRESIKWLQAFFDEGQSSIPMPNRQLGLLKSVLSLLPFDKKLHKNDPQKKQWLKKLPHNPKEVISETLFYLGIPFQQYEQFLTLMLTTLPGWASHIQYRTTWADTKDASHPYFVTHKDYLAFRLILTCLIWPKPKELLSWHQNVKNKTNVTNIHNQIAASEADYQKTLIQKLSPLKPSIENTRAKAQLVFCIDVRSEPFRRALETQGEYETYGFAGFFGVPVSIENTVTGESHASCPVLLKPAYNIMEHPNCHHQSCQDKHKKFQLIKKLYQSLKYTFTAPFSLVETLGLASGIWMATRCFFPNLSTALQSSVKKIATSSYTLHPNIQAIPFDQQVAYGEGALKMMGLTENFAPLVVFCGHGSTTQNNAYATALDCGACGGHHGAPNARILAAILNSPNVREAINNKQGIRIPQNTLFLAAEHNTTTDEVEIYIDKTLDSHTTPIASLKKDLKNARNINSLWRSEKMNTRTDFQNAYKLTALRSKDWAQVRPEWGLARNAAFIVAPRSLTKNIDLEGRSFLHSYDWEKDPKGTFLTTILTAPMVVAQWINSQYLFSTLDNVAYGGGSKITKNITGKIGIMQGNASDLMNGLPLQSVFISDNEPYHKPMRLTVVVYAPQTYIDPIIETHQVLQKLFSNGWVHLICYDPTSNEKLILQRDLTWTRLE